MILMIGVSSMGAQATYIELVPHSPIHSLQIRVVNKAFQLT